LIFPYLTSFCKLTLFWSFLGFSCDAAGTLFRSLPGHPRGAWVVRSITAPTFGGYPRFGMHSICGLVVPPQAAQIALRAVTSGRVPMRDEWVAPMVLEFATREKFFRLLRARSSVVFDNKLILTKVAKTEETPALSSPDSFESSLGLPGSLSGCVIYNIRYNERRLFISISGGRHGRCRNKN